MMEDSLNKKIKKNKKNHRTSLWQITLKPLQFPVLITMQPDGFLLCSDS